MKALPSPPPPLSAPKYIDETMAQLPPKNPAFEPNPSCSWADEFLDFSAARRGAHRRSVSDSVAFLETAAPPEFDRLDEDQLLFMFSDHAAQPPPASEDNASVGSDDDNSVVDQKGGAKTMVKAEFEEAHSRNPAAAAAGASPADQIVDSKRVKRILANRQSAQRSRVRKLQYISELERSVNTLQTEVSALSPRVAFLDHQRSILTVGNSHLKQRIAALAQDKLFKDAHQEELKKEIERLRHVYRMQNLKNMEASPSPPPPPPVRGTGKESLC